MLGSKEKYARKRPRCDESGSEGEAPSTCSEYWTPDSPAATDQGTSDGEPQSKRRRSPTLAKQAQTRLRREVANGNERKRMQHINDGYDRLRHLVLPNEEKLSKACLLQRVADEYERLRHELLSTKEMCTQLRQTFEAHASQAAMNGFIPIYPWSVQPQPFAPSVVNMANMNPSLQVAMAKDAEILRLQAEVSRLQQYRSEATKFAQPPSPPQPSPPQPSPPPQPQGRFAELCDVAVQQLQLENAESQQSLAKPTRAAERR